MRSMLKNIQKLDSLLWEMINHHTMKSQCPNKAQMPSSKKIYIFILMEMLSSSNAKLNKYFAFYVDGDLFIFMKIFTALPSMVNIGVTTFVLVRVVRGD